MKICQPFISYLVWPSLTVRPSYTHACGLWLYWKTLTSATLSCVTAVYHAYHHQVHHIHRVTHSHCNRATDRHIARVKSLALLPTSLQSKVILALVVKAITPSRSTGLAESATRMSSWFNRDWPVVRQLTQQHAERSLAFNTCDRAGQVESCQHTNVFE